MNTFYLVIPYGEEGTTRNYIPEEMEMAYTKEEAQEIKQDLTNYDLYDGIIIKRVDLKV